MQKFTVDVICLWFNVNNFIYCKFIKQSPYLEDAKKLFDTLNGSQT